MQTNVPSNVESLALASAFLSGMTLLVLIVMLAVIMRSNRQEQMLESWMAREFSRAHESLDSIRYMLSSQSSSIQQSAPAHTSAPPPASVQSPSAANLPASYPATPASYPPSPYAPPKRIGQNGRDRNVLPPNSRHLLQAVNDLLAGNHPYNFEETLQSDHPRLALMRMSPRGTPDLWSSVVLMDPGGEAYFALVESNRAYLFPNYDRFSGSSDPRPLFDGARLDARILTVQQPAVLSRMSDGAWQLTERGRVQMV